MHNYIYMENNAIVEKSLNFAVRIVNLSKYLRNKKKEYVLSKQILRSGTSIGANVAEAQHGQSTADFAAKMAISLKESNETLYWLTLLHKTNYLTNMQYESLCNDLKEILRLLTAICKTATNK